MLRDACLSECGTYRYWLSRTWAPSLWTGLSECLLYVMLNPSTADANLDDPTIRNCIRIAQAWGYQAIHVVNLFALRATNPKALQTAADPVGPLNDQHILDALRSKCSVVAAWGTHGTYLGRDQTVLRLLQSVNVRVNCLGVNKDGSPRHPLYCPARSEPKPYPPDHASSTHGPT